MNPTSGDIIEERGKQLDVAVERFHRAGLLVVVDLHNEDRRDELDPQWQEAFVRFWGLLAGRLSRFDPELTVLEIVNEPVVDRREEEWNKLNARLAAAIRAGAPRHTIITSGPNWGGIDGLKKLKLLADRNVIYSFHCYDPFAFTHQGATWAGPAVRPASPRSGRTHPATSGRVRRGGLRCGCPPRPAVRRGETARRRLPAACPVPR